MRNLHAVDHHNTGHPHTHIIIRGAAGDSKILNIACDYTAHGVRHRASELVTLELGHQSELEVVDGVYRPSRHVEQVRYDFERQGKDPEAFVRFHVRRLEALRRAGHVERLDDDHWCVPRNLAERGMAYDASRGGRDIAVRTLSTLDLKQQIGSDGATWLDRELIAREPTPIAAAGFGHEVTEALDRRAMRLVDMGHAVADPNGTVRFPRDLLPTLERQEVERAGKELAKARGLTFQQVKAGDYVSGTLAGSTQLASGRYAMIDDGFGFSLAPWQPALDQRIGRHITGIMRDGGGIDWDFGRK